MAQLTMYSREMAELFVSQGYWRTETTAELWDRNAREHPDRLVLVDSRSSLTWAEVKLFSDRFALGLLELGVKRNEIVVMQIPNCVESFIVRLGCEKAGVLCATPLMTLRHREMEHTLQHLDAVSVIIPWQFRNFDFFNMIEELKPELPSLKHILVIGDEVPPGTISVQEMIQQPIEKKYPGDYLEQTRFGLFEFGVIGLTSGTTGLPKFVEHPIPARIAMGAAYARLLKLTPEDTILSAANVVAGNAAVVTYNGAVPLLGLKVILMERWDAGEGLKLIEKEKPTILIAVPAQLVAMVKHPDFYHCDFSSLRAVKLGTAPLPYEVVLEWEKITGSIVVQGYGTFDAGAVAGTNVEQSQYERLQTVGKPYLGVKVKIVDDNEQEVPTGQEGEIVVSGALMASGYYGNPELNKEAWKTVDGENWFPTGDLGKFDAAGNLRIVGRKKDVIIRGGQNIYPTEIEDLLLAHPKVAAAAVIGMPDQMMGEKCCAYVEPKPGEDFTFEEMTSYLKEQKLARYKLPERLEVRSKLPRAGLEKISKKELREELIQLLKAEGKSGD